MYRRLRSCPVVLDIELSVNAWYHNTRRVLLRARRFLLLLLLAAESKERRLAACSTTFKPASNGAETNNDVVPISNTRKCAAPKTRPLEKAFL